MLNTYKQVDKRRLKKYNNLARVIFDKERGRLDVATVCIDLRNNGPIQRSGYESVVVVDSIHDEESLEEARVEVERRCKKGDYLVLCGRVPLELVVELPAWQWFIKHALPLEYREEGRGDIRTLLVQKEEEDTDCVAVCVACATAECRCT